MSLNNPEALRRELDEHLGDGKFDEIHLHLSAKGLLSQAFLKVIAERLREGGRFYHLMQADQQSGLFQSAFTQEDRPDEQMYLRNRGVLEAMAYETGLTLGKYGMRSGPSWYTSVRQIAMKKQTKSRAVNLEKIERLACAYSPTHARERHAHHFAIFEKPRNRPTQG